MSGIISPEALLLSLMSVPCWSRGSISVSIRHPLGAPPPRVAAYQLHQLGVITIILRCDLIFDKTRMSLPVHFCRQCQISSNFNPPPSATTHRTHPPPSRRRSRHDLWKPTLMENPVDIAIANRKCDVELLPVWRAWSVTTLPSHRHQPAIIFTTQSSSLTSSLFSQLLATVIHLPMCLESRSIVRSEVELMDRLTRRWLR